MADWDHEERGRGGPREAGSAAERGWRSGRDWRADSGRGVLEERYGGPTGRGEPRSFGGGRPAVDRGERDMRQARDERPTSYGRTPPPGRPGESERGYGSGGDTAYGQMAGGSSDSGLGGYGGDVGGYGQPNLNSQWGQAGYGPLNQGLDYGQDGSRFGASGFDPNAYGSSRGGSQTEPHDPHHVSYHHWRNTQLSTHDRDYAKWRDEQARRYDEDYGSWRDERHSAFSKEFEGWRAGRGGQAGAPVSAQPAAGGAVPSSMAVNPSERSAYGQAGAGLADADQGSAHGANPTLARIADGNDGSHHHEKTDKPETDRDPSQP